MLKLFNQFIARAVSQEIDRRLADVKKIEPPTGYNPLAKIRGSLFNWVPVPFNGMSVWCKLRSIDSVKQNACGAVTLIDLINESSGVSSLSHMVKIRNIQELLAKEVLVKPSFDEILSIVNEDDIVYLQSKKEIQELEMVDVKSLSPTQRKELEERLDRLRLCIAFILPDDAMGFLTSWALGVDVSDIKNVTKEQLINAAILASRNGNAPSDNLSGVFTDRDKGDIDSVAWQLLDEERKNKAEGQTKSKWIGGGR